MKFRCERYPSLSVCVGDESFITFAAGVFETEDESVAKILRGIEGISEEIEQKKETEPTEPEQKTPAKKKTAKK